MKEKGEFKVVCTVEEAESQLKCLLKAGASFTKHSALRLKTSEEMAEGIRSYIQTCLTAWSTLLGHQPCTNSDREWVFKNAYVTTAEDAWAEEDQPAFYEANLVAFLDVAAELAGYAVRLTEASEDQLRGLSSVMSDMVGWDAWLFQEFTFKAGLEYEHMIGMSSIDHFHSLYRNSLGPWYGAFAQDSWVASAELRHAIEVRFRHAVNVMGVEVDGKCHAIRLPTLLEFLKQSGVQCEVPWSIVEIVYEWANIYVHTAMQSPAWLTGYALQALKPLMCGHETEEGGGSVYNAVQLGPSSMEKVQDKVLAWGKKKVKKSGKGKVRILAFRMEPQAEVSEGDT